MPAMLSNLLRKALTDCKGPWRVVFRYLRCTFHLILGSAPCPMAHDAVLLLRFCGSRIIAGQVLLPVWRKWVKHGSAADRKRWTGGRSRTLAPPRGAAWIVDCSRVGERETNQMQGTQCVGSGEDDTTPLYKCLRQIVLAVVNASSCLLLVSISVLGR
ncbi:hypothetical protein SVAN01_03914 [Stagonosporopsis vannaccii]|nr:hypothetical protein SVAN01_03914 [Stagonosporopsis vannaccii]